ncbi:MAG: DUF2029 domain-containing protein [Ruminococcaceae bacterium]|nr:DUF2029 domain-containing protein [Oscillospiraceae bacterium]
MDSQGKTRDQKGRGLFANSIPLSPSQNRILNIFLYFLLGGTFLCMLLAIILLLCAFSSEHFKNHSFDIILSVFSDFTYIMKVSLEESPFLVEGASYHPIGIIILYPFALICRGIFAEYAGMDLTPNELTAKMWLHPEFWVSYVLFFLICTASIILLVIYEFRLQRSAAIKTAIIITVCAPMAYAITRGNTIFFALIFLLLFIVLHKSENTISREIGYICLAVSGLIKIYPLFFGVLLLCKKRIWESVRVALYTALFFLLPFLFYRNGLDELWGLLVNLTSFATSDAPLMNGANISLAGLLFKVFYALSIPTDTTFNVLHLTLILSIMIFATVTAIAARSDLSRYVIAVSTFALIPSVSYFYVLIFILIPFMQFIREYDALPRYKQILYSLFFMTFLCTAFVIPMYFVPQTLIIITMLVIEGTDTIKKDMIRRKA